MNLDPLIRDKTALALLIYEQLGGWPEDIHDVRCKGEYDFFHSYYNEGIVVSRDHAEDPDDERLTEQEYISIINKQEQ